MGHIVGKDIYRKLGKKIDGLSMRAPWNEKFYAILRELYSAEEADLVVRMPYGLSTMDKIEEVTGYERTKLEKLTEGMCSKGLVVDVWIGGEYRYIPSPIIIGIFEFTMMRTGGNLNMKEWGRLFHEYLLGEDTYYAANFGKGQTIGPLRTLPYEDAIEESEYVEILDYEKASAIVEQSRKFAIGICSCRHEKLHAGVKECDVPLETCSSFDFSAEFLIRHDMGREISREEMLDNLARSKELGLVLSADNVKTGPSFICHCCKCCCNILLGLNRFGYVNSVVTSSFIVEKDEDVCTECESCAEACPVGAIEKQSEGPPSLNTSICIGCGVCALQCETEALRLVKRQQRVFHPEDTFERIILQCLERGTLQNQMFSNPQSVTHAFMRGVVGAFLRLPPVKKALMSDALRSSFLSTLRR